MEVVPQVLLGERLCIADQQTHTSVFHSKVKTRRNPHRLSGECFVVFAKANNPAGQKRFTYTAHATERRFLHNFSDIHLSRKGKYVYGDRGKKTVTTKSQTATCGIACVWWRVRGRHPNGTHTRTRARTGASANCVTHLVS